MAMLLRRHRKARAEGVTTSESVTPGSDAPAKALADMDKAELQAEAERRGLPKTGNKPALRERIEAHDAEQAANAASNPEGSGESPDETGENGGDSAEQGDGGENPEGDADDAADGDESGDSDDEGDAE